MPSTPQTSWLASANIASSGFPLASLPFCTFEFQPAQSRIGIGIGDSILDLNALTRTGLLRTVPWATRRAGRCQTLNELMKLGSASVNQLRAALQQLLSDDASSETVDAIRPLLHSMRDVKLTKPVRIGNYTDFYASIQHATNVGKLFRPDQPLLPNYKHLPIGYHGRASSICVSPGPIVRPHGQVNDPASSQPVFQPTAQLDYELELAAFVAQGNTLGHPIPIAQAPKHLFGISLLNDWSARDIQSWEYQPLGPFLGKSFATTIAPWVIPMQALEPYIVAASPRPEDDPRPLPYLQEEHHAAFDIQLEAFLSTANMRAHGLAPALLSRTNARHLYWTFPQMLAHNTSNGCNLQPGDILASGTISGATADSLGCLLEITERGVKPLALPNGETRSFLEDGDEIILRGFCERDGLPRITLGECRGTIVANS